MRYKCTFDFIDCYPTRFYYIDHDNKIVALCSPCDNGFKKRIDSLNWKRITQEQYEKYLIYV